MLRNQEEERWKVEELKAKENLFMNALLQEIDRRVEREKLLNEAKERKKKVFLHFINQNTGKGQRQTKLNMKRELRKMVQSHCITGPQIS